MAGTATRKQHKSKTAQRPRKAPMYKVLVHNDDVTTYFFVVAVLAFIFKIEVSMAEKIAMEAHKNGVALVTILPLEQAELRIDQAHSRAKTAKYPLRFSYEPA